MTENILQIKKAWEAGVANGKDGASILDPEDQEDCYNWRDLAKMFVAEGGDYPHVFYHGYLFGYYEEYCSENYKPMDPDLKAYDLACHMAESMRVLL